MHAVIVSCVVIMRFKLIMYDYYVVIAFAIILYGISIFIAYHIMVVYDVCSHCLLGSYYLFYNCDVWLSFSRYTHSPSVWHIYMHCTSHCQCSLCGHYPSYCYYVVFNHCTCSQCMLHIYSHCLPRCHYASHSLDVFCLMGFYVLARYQVTLKQAATWENEHTWRLYSVTPLAGQSDGTMS